LKDKSSQVDNPQTTASTQVKTSQKLLPELKQTGKFENAQKLKPNLQASIQQQMVAGILDRSKLNDFLNSLKQDTIKSLGLNNNGLSASTSPPVETVRKSKKVRKVKKSDSDIKIEATGPTAEAATDEPDLDFQFERRTIKKVKKPKKESTNETTAGSFKLPKIEGYRRRVSIDYLALLLFIQTI
jgi:hypothetical protein